MTKEEIREKHLFKNGLSVNNTAVGKKIQKSAYDAMEEYAVLKAIKFAEWTQINDWAYSDNTEWEKGIGMWIGVVNEKVVNWTSEEVYKLYLKELENE